MQVLRAGILNVIILNKIGKFEIRTGLRTQFPHVIRTLSKFEYLWLTYTSKSFYEYVNNIK
jgi:hypothetical protein